MNFCMPRFHVHHHPLKLAQTHSVGLLTPPNHLILCHAFCCCLQYFPGSRVLFCFVFPMSWLFPSGGQSIGASASVFPLKIQGWFPLGLTGWISLQSKGLSRVFSILQHHSLKGSILQHSAFFMVQLLHLYLTPGKTIALTLWTFVGKVMSLSFKTLPSFVTTFLPSSEHLLISWLQSPSAVILELKKINSVTVSIVSSSIFHEVMRPLPVWTTTNWKILKEMGIPDHLTCLLRNLYAGQEATLRTGHGTSDWFQIGKGVRQDYILLPCLFNLNAEYIMKNTGLDEAQSGIKIAGETATTSDMQMMSP